MNESSTDMPTVVFSLGDIKEIIDRCNVSQEKCFELASARAKILESTTWFSTTHEATSGFQSCNRVYENCMNFVFSLSKSKNKT